MADLVRHEKFIFQRRYVIEITVHQVAKSNRYLDGLKWRLICIDQESRKRVLMDNHHPNGAHIHVVDKEFLYEFKNLDALVLDFRRLVREHMRIEI